MNHEEMFENTSDMSSIGEVTEYLGRDIERGQKLTRKEVRAAKKELNRRLKEAARQEKLAAKEARRAKKADTKAKGRVEPAQQASSIVDRDKKAKELTRDFKKKRRNARNVLDAIAYNHMYKDGICELESDKPTSIGLFSQTIKFDDISYQSARDDKQRDIFTIWGGLYDYFGEETQVQITVVNKQLPETEIGKRTFFDVDAQDNENARMFAEEFNKILNKKMLEGVSNIKRERYLSYRVSAKSAEAAIPSLARIRNDVLGEMQKINCRAEVLDGASRLEAIHNILKPEVPFEINFDKEITQNSGLTTKDLIAPSVLDFKPEGSSTYFKSDDMYCQVLVMRRFGSELTDRALSELVDLPIPLVATWHVNPIDKSHAKELVARQSAWIDKEIVEDQKHAVKNGYDFTILPQNLKSHKENIESLHDHIHNKNQRLFYFTGLIYTYGKDLAELQERVMQIISTARRNSIEIETLDFRQQEGLNSILPLAYNHIDIGRYFTTAELAMLIPFATMELDMPGGNYEGQNRYSNNLIMCNRKRLASPIGFICGKTGSGKSFAVKQEIMCSYLNSPNDQFIIFDRAGEYKYLCDELIGTEIVFSPDSMTHLNPFDISTSNGDSYISQVAFKIDAMLAQAQAAAVDSGVGLTDAEQSIISRAVEETYRIAAGKGIDPILEDYYTLLKEQPEGIAQEIALRYERFVHGSMSMFNHQSNVTWQNRVINLNLKELPDTMVTFALISLCESARNQMYKNYNRGVRTWIYVEEVQSLMNYDAVINYYSRWSNEARKFGGLITGLTQNATAILENPLARPMLLNADYIKLMKQSPVDRKEWTELYNLSEQEQHFIDETCDKGAGLLIAGDARVPFIGGFPKANVLYEIFSTDPNEREEAARKELLLQNQNK